jgi:geranylgeranyl reductase family protein
MVNENLEYNITRKEEPVISMVMRDTFDSLIINKAKEKGATLLEKHKVNSITKKENGLILHTENGEISAKFIIAADGALSPIAKMAGWEDTRYLIPALEYEVEVSESDFNRLSGEVRFDINFIPGGYAWSFPKKNHLSLGVASTKRGKVDLHAYYKQYLKELGIHEVIKESMHGFQIPISPRTDGFYKNNVLLTGDAAGFADPITAEGISNAIYSGILAAQSIIEGDLESNKVEALYQKKISEKLLPELKTARFLANIFYSKNWLRKQLFKKYGHTFADAMCDIFTGKKSYPTDAKKVLKKYVRSLTSN